MRGLNQSQHSELGEEGGIETDIHAPGKHMYRSANMQAAQSTHDVPDPTRVREVGELAPVSNGLLFRASIAVDKREYVHVCKPGITRWILLLCLISCEPVASILLFNKLLATDHHF